MAEDQTRRSKVEGLNQPDIDQEWLKQLQTPVLHASECQNSQCDVSDCKKIKRLFTHSSNCKVRIYGGCRMCETLWFLISLHANSCSTSNCAVPTCKEWREDLRRIANKSEPSQSEVLGKLLMDLAIGSEADSSARSQKMNQLVEQKASKGKGSLETGSGSGSSSGLVSGSTARQKKVKQQAESAPNKNKVSQKLLLEQLVMGSVSSSGSGSGSGSGRSARQQRMKQRVAEGSRKSRTQIQNKKRYEYTAQDKNIICGLTFLTVYALFGDMMKK